MQILIAHKDKGISDQIKYQLTQNESMEVAEILNHGSQAEDYIFMHKPDIAILDFKLEETDAITIAKRLQDAGVQTKIIVLTKALSDDVLLTGLAHGILGYLTEANIDTHLLQCAERVQNNLVYVEEEGSN